MIGNFKVKRIRNLEHLKFIRTLPCIMCGQTEKIHAHHIRMDNECGTGLKPNDSSCVCLCALCHTKLHTHGEKLFWGSMNPNIIASSLYRCFIGYGVWYRRERALMSINKWRKNGKENIHINE